MSIWVKKWQNNYFCFQKMRVNVTGAGFVVVSTKSCSESDLKAKSLKY